MRSFIGMKSALFLSVTALTYSINAFLEAAPSVHSESRRFSLAIIRR